MIALSLTEKQQEVLWLRYGQRKSIDEIAKTIGIGRRAVLARLRNMRRRLADGGYDLADLAKFTRRGKKTSVFAASQISGRDTGGLHLDDC